MIQLIQNRQDFLDFRKNFFDKVGLIPTMGNLHAGHISLLEESLKKYDMSIVTIFVNPTQFGPNEDFDKYPRTLKQDLQRIEQIQRHYPDKKVVVFAPEKNSDIYPQGYATTVSVDVSKDILCGKSRPGHFDGVTTVVYQLLALSHPTEAFFGEKDFQQLYLIKKMVKDLSLPYLITGLPIVREEDGLALSSRNQYLSSQERPEALKLYQALQKLRTLVQEHGHSAKIVKDYQNNILADKRFEYFEVLDAETLQEPHKGTHTYFLPGAFQLSKARLIDNLTLDLNSL